MEKLVVRTHPQAGRTSAPSRDAYIRPDASGGSTVVLRTMQRPTGPRCPLTNAAACTVIASPVESRSSTGATYFGARALGGVPSV